LDRTSTSYVNYQQRASEFAVGDVVVPFGGFESFAGRVTAVWPAIGMVDVEFATGSKRYPVEEIQRFDPDGNADPPKDDSVPGGQPTVSVPGGPFKGASAMKVADAHRKRSLYWASKDRKYRMRADEAGSGSPSCPRCKDVPLKRAIYKRRDGSSDKLMGCPGCMFLIKDADIVNFHPVADEIEVEHDHQEVV
jgi:hypothetical protein